MKNLSLRLQLTGLLALLLTGSMVFAADFNSLIGRWHRPDGGYILEIRRVDSEGKMEAGYFNPRAINVSQAQASMNKDYLKVEVELRDRGYPGSTYTLVYLQDRDALVGYYFHAASGQNFEVAFVRQR